MVGVVKNLILWRHAEAVLIMPKQNDWERELTAKGVKQSQKMARWLKKHLPKDTLVLTSPALRAIQTSDAYTDLASIRDILKPEADIKDILTYVAESKAESVMLVGHQPWMGQVATYLLGLKGEPLSIKKGAIWWLRLSHDTSGLYKIYTVQTPKLLD
ncbi:MAG TPA: phosphohistidine phosphatase SixA [Methylophilaceae bacterium]|nr:phosphohistidine phosphatase SixA [Methylophilaceae bacterium]HAJ70874.1 phosphohistidine phosphatase SixA [Methylophilaceae bacterium]